MDSVTEDFARSDVDTEMTALTPEDISEETLDASDEVENLRKSLREVVHDDNVQPKMQCLMMDSSFTMVTMQGEDSGIAWETTPSRCSTPWASEAGSSTLDLSSTVVVRHAQPGSVPAGKIIFVMDEELISRRKKTKERASGQRKQREVLAESSENISGRPELVGVSEPNLKTKREGPEEESAEPQEDKEQWLFSLVSEGSEILNIVVPPKHDTVDEAESKEMVDNLSYLEDSPAPKASKETNDNEIMFLTDTPTVSVEQTQHSFPIGPHGMDPPGAPVARPPGRGASGHVDYFEAFHLIDAQAPGSPAVVAERQVETEVEGTADSQDPAKQAQSENTTANPVNLDRSDTVSLEEINIELLDEVFYGGTDEYLNKERAVRGGDAKGKPLRLPSKPSGSSLFGSQEDMLTPIFLPEGPPKIIDPILLEEPQAMAFLYTDLYEEAIGSRQKEEDTESMTSEKSFHSRHSDREARGYLEKYALVDETPVVEMVATDKEKGPEEGFRTLCQELYDFDCLSKPEKGEVPNSEEEITDFFRSSANSSPCDMEPLSRSVEEDDTQPAQKTRAKTKKNVTISVGEVTEIPVDPLSISSFEFPAEEPDWGTTDDHPTTLDEKDICGNSDQQLWKQDLEVQKPVAPPRKKAATSPKASLDLTPLTPVDAIIQEKEEAGGKEQREEEKETASPEETADEGDGDGEETIMSSLEVSMSEYALAAEETEIVKESNEITNTKPAAAEEEDTKIVEEEQRETATKQTESEEINMKSPDSAITEVNPEKQGDSSAALSTEPAKDKGHCIIL